MQSSESLPRTVPASGHRVSRARGFRAGACPPERARATKSCRASRHTAPHGRHVRPIRDRGGHERREPDHGARLKTPDRAYVTRRIPRLGAVGDRLRRAVGQTQRRHHPGIADVGAPDRSGHRAVAKPPRRPVKAAARKRCVPRMTASCAPHLSGSSFRETARGDVRRRPDRAATAAAGVSRRFRGRRRNGRSLPSRSRARRSRVRSSRRPIPRTRRGSSPARHRPDWSRPSPRG